MKYENRFNDLGSDLLCARAEVVDKPFGWLACSPKIVFVNSRIRNSGFFTKRAQMLLGATLRSAWPVDHTACFTELLLKLDAVTKDADPLL